MKIKEIIKTPAVKKLSAIAVVLCVSMLIYTVMNGKTDAKVSLSRETESILSKIEGAGEVNVMIYEAEGNIEGVCVICEGADDISVRIRLQSAVTTLLGVDNNRVEVLPMQIIDK